MKILVDAMGGDNAPQSTVEGSVLAARELGVEIVLVGQEKAILSCLEKVKSDDVVGKIEVVNAPEVIDMCDSPMSVTKEKKDSSLGMALRLLSEGKGDAMVSGGLSSKEAVAAVLADENNSYSKNELKAAALNLKRLFGG